MINHPPPWLACGAQIRDNELTSDWQHRAGLDFDVIKRDISYFSEDEDSYYPIENTSALVRIDTGKPLSIVSNNRYKIVQPMDILEFYRGVAEGNNLKLEAGGALNGGKIIWALASTGRGFVTRGDRMTEYVLLSTGFDGKATKGCLITRRDSCWNTLEIATNKGTHKFSVTHAQVFDPTKASLNLDFVGASEFMKQIEKMAVSRISENGARKFFTDLYYPGIDPEDLNTGQRNRILTLMMIYSNNPTQTDIRGSLWGVVNAVSFTQDHLTQARSADNRLTSAWFGSGNNIKTKAFEQAIRLLN